MMRKNARKALIGAGALLPIVLVVTLGKMFHIPSTGRGGYAADSKGPELFIAVSTDAHSIALAILAATALLFRESRSDQRAPAYWAVGTLAVLAAIGSSYSSFSYRIGLAHQLSAGMFNPDAFAVRLIVQGLLLILALSALIVLTLMTFLRASSAAREDSEA